MGGLNNYKDENRDSKSHDPLWYPRAALADLLGTVGLKPQFECQIVSDFMRQQIRPPLIVNRIIGALMFGQDR